MYDVRLSRELRVHARHVQVQSPGVRPPVRQEARRLPILHRLQRRLLLLDRQFPKGREEGRGNVINKSTKAVRVSTEVSGYSDSG